MERIIVSIDADGEVKVEAKGVRGSGCAAMTKAIEEAIGRTTLDLKTPEYFQRENQTAANRASNNAG